MDERPEALLKSALEKIVYFEARSEQLQNDFGAARAEGERLRADLGVAAQREIELRRLVAELEVRSTRSHAKREESARVVEALRRERAELIGKMLEASRIHGAGSSPDPDSFDLARFISELRGEVLHRTGRPAARAGRAGRRAAARAVAQSPRSPRQLKAQGRLAVPPRSRLRPRRPHRRDAVRLLGARAVGARRRRAIRAAERLKALGQPAAAPALATALHGETEPTVQVALLQAFAHFAKGEGVAVVRAAARVAVARRADRRAQGAAHPRPARKRARTWPRR